MADQATAPLIEFYQRDWMPGFAAFIDDGKPFEPSGRAFCLLNLGAILAAVELGDMPASEVPYFVAESMMHEIMHVLEKWAGVEFSEERIEQLLDRYRTMAQSGG